MHFSDKIGSNDLERRESQLTVFACVAIGILALGTALLMYPVVFSRQAAPPDKTMRIAFVGFCVLCLLLAGYLWERQSTIGRLRRQMVEERGRGLEAQRQASMELLKAMPNFGSFQDRLTMEYRRTVATTQKLSIVVVMLTLPHDNLATDAGASLLGDAAKVISRKLREQDSVFILTTGCFGVVLPGAEREFAEHVQQRISEGLTDAAGASDRFAFRIDTVNYPADGASAHELELAVCALMPADNTMQAMAQAIVS